jgi:hypothetical protein
MELLKDAAGDNVNKYDVGVEQQLGSRRTLARDA